MENPSIVTKQESIDGNILARLDALEQAISDLQRGSAVIEQDAIIVGDLILWPDEGVLVTDPTDTAYSGGFASGEGLDFGGTTFTFGYVKDGVIQWGGDKDAASLIAGAGVIKLDEDGVSVYTPSGFNDVNSYKFINAVGTVLAGLYYYGSTMRTMHLRNLDPSFVNTMLVTIEAYGSQGEIGLWAHGTGGKNVNVLLSSASAPEISLNYYGLDVDTQIKGNSDDNLVYADAGNDRVGIGKNNPAEKLDVNGNIKANNFVTDKYTPTLTDVQNITSSSVAAAFLYARIGTMVIVTGNLDVEHDGSGIGQVGLTLPIASDFTASTDLNGNATSVKATTEFAASVVADDTNDRAQLNISAAVGTASQSWRIVFMYEVK